MLDLKRKTVSYCRRTNWVPKGTERVLALKPELVDHLTCFQRVWGQPCVFLDWDDKPVPPRTFERMIQRLISLCRIPHATLHDFRHTYASHLAMAGVTLIALKDLLGHKNIETVMIYSHLTQKHLQQAAEALPY